MTRFRIIVTAHNASAWIARCLTSVLSQSYPLWQCVFVDDASTDATFTEARRVASQDERFTVLRQLQRQESHLANQNLAISCAQPATHDVIVILDGDDWLHDAGVLARLAIDFNEPEVWLSYGSFVLWTSDDAPLDSSWQLPPYSPEVLRAGTVRQAAWAGSHLRVFRAGLWRAIDQDRYCSRAGKLVHVAVDQATMFPMMEMARERCIHVPQPLLVYNFANPQSVGRRAGGKAEADEMSTWLRSLPPCARLPAL